MTKRRRILELGKDVLIVLLTCSAVWLAARSQLPVRGLLREETAQARPQAQSEGRIEAARPLRITACLSGGAEPVRYGALYDGEACAALFQQVAGLLMEALSSAGQPEAISRRQWEAALSSAPGVAFDFQGEIPLGVLSGWLSGEETSLTASARRLVLAVQRDTASLFYQEGDAYFRCPAEVVNPLHLEQALSALTGNGAFYAFESEACAALDPDTLLPAQTPEPAVYSATNPVSGGQAALEALAAELGLPINANGVYYAGEWVARSGSDTLRLSNRGELVYLAGEEGGQRLLTGGSATLLNGVEACRRLAFALMGSRCGQARLYLSAITPMEQGWEISFQYSLDGIPVTLETGPAARFQVRSGRITQFSMSLRSYVDSGTRSRVLPLPQAAAALEAMGLEGEELLLVYRDSGGDTVPAGWAAGGHREG